MMNSVCTGNQVSSLIWGQHHQELFSGHGFTDNEVVAWSYPKMERIQTLSYHQDRILSMDLSPDGNQLVSIGADENLCLWKVDAAPTRRRTAVAVSPSFGSRFTIR
jgi:WD40 repeat protein